MFNPSIYIFSHKIILYIHVCFKYRRTIWSNTYAWWCVKAAETQLITEEQKPLWTPLQTMTAGLLNGNAILSLATVKTPHHNAPLIFFTTVHSTGGLTHTHIHTHKRTGGFLAKGAEACRRKQSEMDWNLLQVFTGPQATHTHTHTYIVFLIHTETHTHIDGGTLWGFKQNSPQTPLCSMWGA